MASLGSLILSNPAKHLFLSWCQCHHQNTGNVLVNPHALLLYFPWCTWHFLSPLREGQKVSNSQQEESLGSSSGLAGPTLLMGPPRNHTPGCQLPPAACLLRPGLGQGRREGAHQWKQEVTCLMAAIALCLGFQIRKQCQRFPPPISNSTSRNTTSSGWTAVARKMGDSDPADLFLSASAASNGAEPMAAGAVCPHGTPVCSLSQLFSSFYFRCAGVCLAASATTTHFICLVFDVLRL